MIRLKELRKQQKKSQADLATALHTDQTAISKWENGERKLNIMQAKEIADYFGVSVDYLLGSNELERPDPYYFDPEVAEMAEELKNNPEYRVLLDASRKMSKKDMKIILDLAKRMAAEDDTHHIE